MIHLFKNIYLQDDNQISPRYELMAIAANEKDHPLNLVFNQNVGRIQAFQQVLKENYKDDVENFWYELIEKNHPRPYVVYADTELFLRLLFSYWKSIFASTEVGFHFEMYHFARIDNELKALAPTEREKLNHRTGNGSYPILKLEEFEKLFNQAPVSKAISNLNKGFMPIEYLISNYFFEKKETLTPFLKKQVLNLAWTDWCRDIEDLKSEVVSGFYNISAMFPEVQSQFLPNYTPQDLVRLSPSLQWILDREIRPDNIEYIRAAYPIDFFPKMQALIDKICRVQIQVKGIRLDDIDVFNQASQTEFLYNDDFEAILKRDVQRGFGSFFLKNDLLDRVNHFLLNHIYDLVKSNKNLELAKFKLR